MRNIFTIMLLTAVAVLGLQKTVSANSITITSSINWSAITSGSGTGGKPGATDQITVRNGATLTVNITGAVCSSLILGGTDGTAGTLSFSMGNSPSITVSGTIIVGSGISGGNGRIATESGSSLTCGGLTLSSTSDATVLGTDATITINGAITAGSGGTYNWQSNGTVILATASSLPASVFTHFYNLTINPGSGNTVTLGTDIAIQKNLAISSGTLACSSFNITGNTTGTFTMASGTNLTLGNTSSSSGVQFPSGFSTAKINLNPASTVTYQANGDQNVSCVPVYGNLILSSGSSQSTKTIAGGAVTVVSALTISNDTKFDVSLSNYGLNVAGNFTNNGTFGPEGGTVTMDGIAAQTIGGSTAATFNNLTISNTNAPVSLDINLTVSGTLTVNSNAALDMKTNNLTVGTPLNSGIISTQISHAISAGKTWGGIINFNGSDPQFITDGTYATIKVNNASLVFLIGNITINSLIIGDVTSNSVFSDEGYTISGANNLTITSGTYKCSASNFPWANQNIGGLVKYISDAAQTIAGKTYTNLFIHSNSISTKLADGNLTVNGSLTLDGTLDMSTFALNVNSAPTSGSIYTQNTFTAPIPTGKTWGCSVNFNGSSGQTIPGGTYSELSVDNPAGAVLAGAVTVSGTLTIGSYTTLAFSGTTSQTLTLNGTLSNSGIIDMSPGNRAHVLQVGGSSISFGTLVTGTGSKIEYTSTTGGQTINSTLAYNNLQLDNTSGTNSAGGNLTVNGSLTLAGTLDMSTFALNINSAPTSGSINTQNTSSTPIPAGKTWGCSVNFNGSSGQTIPGGTFSKLSVNNPAGAVLAGAVAISGMLTITSNSKLDVSTDNWALNIGGDYINNGTFTQRTGTVTMNGTAAQSIGGSIAATFNNLTISNTSATVSSLKDLTVSGTLTVNSSAALDMKTNFLSVGTPLNSGIISTQNTSGAGSFSANKTWGGIINFNGSNHQYIPGGSYATIKVNNASKVTLYYNSIINSLIIGDVTSNSVFSDNGYTINGNNLTITSGTYNCLASNFPWLNQNIGGLVKYMSNSAQTIAGRIYTNLSVSGGTSSTPITKMFDAGLWVTGGLTIGSYTTLAFGEGVDRALTLDGNLSNNGIIDMSAGNLAHQLRVGGRSNSFGTLVTGTGSIVVYTSATGGQTINSTWTYNNLQLDNTSGTDSAGGNLTVNGSLTLAGTLDMGMFTLNVNSAPTSGRIYTRNTSSTPISANKIWGGTLNFNGSSYQTVPAGTFAGLQVNNAAGVILGGNVNVKGLLTMTSGNLTTTKPYSLSFGATGTVSGEGSGHYIIGNLIMDENIGTGASSSRLNGIGVSIGSGTDNPGTVEVRRMSGAAGQGMVGSNTSIYRKWSITSSNSSSSARNLTLTWVPDDVPYEYSLTSAKVWKSTNSGTSWSAVGSSGDLSSNTVTVPLVSSSSYTLWTVSNNAAVQQKALLFGGGQYAITPASSALKTGNVTIEIWIKPTPPITAAEEILRLKSSSADDGCEFQVMTDGNVSFKALLSTWSGTTTTGVNVLDGNWHHLVGVVNGNEILFYVDGILKGDYSFGATLNYASNVQMYLGMNPNASSYYKGTMSEVRIWNTARTQSDIQANMHTTMTGSESGLIGYWPLNGGTSTTAYDIAAGNNCSLQSFTFDGSTNGWVPITDLALPVELTEFSAKANSGSVLLSWKTATEVNNYGFDIERSLVTGHQSLENPQSEIRNSKWEKIGFVEGAGNSNSPKDYSFIDENPYLGNIQYRLKQIDNDGDFTHFGTIAEVNINRIDVKENQIPKEFGLSQNYPNPFNPSTVISYQLPVSSNVTLKVYDTIGREVETLVDGNQQAGYYNINFNGSKLSSGIYIYRLTAGQFISTRKLMLVK